MYVELYGETTQDEKTLNFPVKVYLRLRHMGQAIFRGANGKTKVFHQPLGSERKFEFNRFEITNAAECIKDKKQGKSKLNCPRYVYLFSSSRNNRLRLLRDAFRNLMNLRTWLYAAQ